MIANLIHIINQYLCRYSPTRYYPSASHYPLTCHYHPSRHYPSPRYCRLDPQSSNAKYLTLSSFLPTKRRATGCRVKHGMTMRDIYFNFIKYLCEQIAMMASSLRGVSAQKSLCGVRESDQRRQRTFFGGAREGLERADGSNNKNRRSNDGFI